MVVLEQSAFFCRPRSQLARCWKAAHAGVQFLASPLQPRHVAQLLPKLPAISTSCCGFRRPGATVDTRILLAPMLAPPNIKVY